MPIKVALRFVGTVFVLLCLLEGPSSATSCDRPEIIGEIWELERVGAPHLSSGETVDAQESRWLSSGTLEGTSYGGVRVDTLATGSIEFEETGP